MQGPVSRGTKVLLAIGCPPTVPNHYSSCSMFEINVLGTVSNILSIAPHLAPDARIVQGLYSKFVTEYGDLSRNRFRASRQCIKDIY